MKMEHQPQGGKDIRSAPGSLTMKTHFKSIGFFSGNLLFGSQRLLLVQGTIFSLSWEDKCEGRGTHRWIDASLSSVSAPAHFGGFVHLGHAQLSWGEPLDPSAQRCSQHFGSCAGGTQRSFLT